EATVRHGGTAVEDGALTEAVGRQQFVLGAGGEDEGATVAGQVVNPAIGKNGRGIDGRIAGNTLLINEPARLRLGTVGDPEGVVHPVKVSFVVEGRGNVGAFRARP